jgi:decaprenylphospho-beta-D-erythro-pentofuranosid-2-ulose 2-reductase
MTKSQTEMQSVLILGAGSDIAFACAGIWAKAGKRIMLAGRDTNDLQRRAADLKVRYEAEVSFHEFDARKYDSHKAFYQALPYAPDIVLCAFGYLGDQTRACLDFNEALRIIESNYTGAVSILNIAAESMIQRKAGGIIGISSVAGERGRMSNYHYGSAKAGFTAYLSGLRNRMAHEGLHVMTVKPGFVRTRMTEGLPLPAPLTASAEQAGGDIVKSWSKKQNVVYTLWMWKWVMLIIRNIPESIFKKLKL